VPRHEPGPDAGPASGVSAAGRLSPRPGGLVLRFALLGCAYLAWGALALIMVSYHGGSSSSISVVNGHVTRVVRRGVTVYQENPGPVRIVLLVLGGAVLVSTASISWRVVRHSQRVGVAGIIVGGVAGLVALLGMLTIGPFILPLASLLIVRALPITPSPAERSPLPDAGDTLSAHMTCGRWDGSVP